MAVKIARAEEHRRAIREAQKLDHAREGTPEYRRRQELHAVMRRYELHHPGPTAAKGGRNA